MKKFVLDFVNTLEGFKTACHSLHWDAKNLSQHKLCDEIMDSLSDFQDKIAEVEQSISGRLAVNNLSGKNYHVTTLKKFIEDVISSTKSFYAKLKKLGDDYIGMRSDVEAFLSDLQRFSYLVDFTIKEELKQRLRDKINEGRIELSVGNTTFSMTENELRDILSEAIDNVKRKQRMGRL